MKSKDFINSRAIATLAVVLYTSFVAFQAINYNVTNGGDLLGYIHIPGSPHYNNLYGTFFLAQAVEWVFSSVEVSNELLFIMFSMIFGLLVPYLVRPTPNGQMVNLVRLFVFAIYVNPISYLILVGSAKDIALNFVLIVLGIAMERLRFHVSLVCYLASISIFLLIRPYYAALILPLMLHWLSQYRAHNRYIAIAVVSLTYGTFAHNLYIGILPVNVVVFIGCIFVGLTAMEFVFRKLLSVHWRFFTSDALYFLGSLAISLLVLASLVIYSGFNIGASIRHLETTLCITLLFLRRLSK